MDNEDDRVAAEVSMRYGSEVVNEEFGEEVMEEWLEFAEREKGG